MYPSAPSVPYPDPRTMIRPILQLGDSVLKSVARPIERIDLAGEAFRTLASEMAETLSAAGGVGLAAPQIGESVRLILAGSFPTEANPDRPLVPIAPLINPRIIFSSADTEAGWEGCLSFLRFRVRVYRHASITVEFLTPDGHASHVEATGFYARVLQHEIDHLDGVLTLDRAASPDDIRLSDAPEPGHTR
jgi:peptide deformylase